MPLEYRRVPPKFVNNTPAAASLVLPDHSSQVQSSRSYFANAAASPAHQAASGTRAAHARRDLPAAGWIAGPLECAEARPPVSARPSAAAAASNHCLCCPRADVFPPRQMRVRQPRHRLELGQDKDGDDASSHTGESKRKDQAMTQTQSPRLGQHTLRTHLFSSVRIRGRCDAGGRFWRR